MSTDILDVSQPNPNFVKVKFRESFTATVFATTAAGSRPRKPQVVVTSSSGEDVWSLTLRAGLVRVERPSETEVWVIYV